MGDKSTITIEVAPGELIDKITILEIKSEHITDQGKLENIRVELQTLEASRDAAIEPSDRIGELTARLKAVNERLWDVEDAMRECGRRGDFGPRFVEAARAEYTLNDERAAIKRSINELLGSRIMEEKSYEGQ